MIVPRHLTPIDLADLSDVLEAGGQRALGESPGPQRLALAWAQLVEEHGRKDGALEFVFNYNLGNIDATPEERHTEIDLFITKAEHEGSGDEAWLARHTRRSFDTAQDGAAYYWAALRDRYSAAFAAMAMGNAATFVGALKALHYFTGNVDDYTRSVASIVAEHARASAQRQGT